METNFVRRFALCACVALAAAGGVWADEAADRKAALARKRDVMYYATGYDPCYWPKGTPYSQAAFWNSPKNSRGPASNTTVSAPGRARRMPANCTMGQPVRSWSSWARSPTSPGSEIK